MVRRRWYNSELLDEMIQRGYVLKDEGRFKECCNLWLEVWRDKICWKW
jgi:hypothetical protein